MSKAKIKNRPMFPNHIEKVDAIRAAQIERGTREYSGNVLNHARDLGIKYPIMTCKQRDNKYTRQNLYGLELEISTDLSASQLYNAADYPFFIIKSDSSVSRCRAFALEVVGVPATLKANCVLWSRWADKVIEKCESDLELIGGSGGNGTNGIHVHVDKQNFIDTRHLRNFLVFFNLPWHQWFMFQMSDRNEWNNLERWAKPLTLHKNGKLSSWIKNIESGCRNQDKYAFTNMRHSDTVEVRIFQGDLSAATITKNLQFVDSIVEFTKERSASTCDLKFYMKWLEATDKGRYTELKQFISSIDLNPTWAEYEFWKDLYRFNKKDTTGKYRGQKRVIVVPCTTCLWDRIANADLHTVAKMKYVDNENSYHITVEFKEPKTTPMYSFHKKTVSRYSRIRSFVSEAA